MRTGSKFEVLHSIQSILFKTNNMPCEPMFQHPEFFREISKPAWLIQEPVLLYKFDSL